MRAAALLVLAWASAGCGCDQDRSLADWCDLSDAVCQSFDERATALRAGDVCPPGGGTVGQRKASFYACGEQRQIDVGNGLSGWIESYDGTGRLVGVEAYDDTPNGCGFTSTSYGAAAKLCSGELPSETYCVQ